MPGRSSRFRPRVSSSRRKTTWSAGPSGAIEITASGSALFLAGAAAADDGLTLVRTRGELLVYLSSVNVALDGMKVAVGICIVSENAFNVGIMAIPQPLTDIGWDGWLWYWTGHMEAVGNITEADFQGQLGAMAARIEIDSKAMRKIKRTDVQCAVVEVVESGTVAVQLRLDIRVLDKLS